MEILHQVSTQRTVQQGIPQWGWWAEEIPRHGGDQGRHGKEQPLTHQTVIRGGDKE